MLFQRELLRPVTGVVDRRTWDEISRAWSQLEREQADPGLCGPFPGRGARWLRARSGSSWPCLS